MTGFKDRKKNSNIGKVIIVTVLGKGIGKSIAKEFAENGYSVVLNARDESELKESAKEIMRETMADDNNIIFISGDVSREENCKSLIDGAISRFGRVDVLVNNAGIKGASKKITDLTISEWSEVTDINLKSAFFFTREALKHMLKMIWEITTLTIIFQSSIFPLCMNRYHNLHRSHTLHQRGERKCLLKLWPWM